MLRRAIATLATVLAFTPAALALTLTGNAEVIGSDILRLEGYRVYLLGVESMDAGQACAIRGQEWECYPAAVRALQTIVSEGPVTCNVVSGPDVLLQVIAVCMVNGTDIGERLVGAGFGLVVSGETDAYQNAMMAAQAVGIGLWQGTFAPPAIWREANRIFVGRPAFRPGAPTP